VRPIIENVRTTGDRAVRFYNKKFGGGAGVFKVNREEIVVAYKSTDKFLLRSLRLAKRNIEIFHKQNLCGQREVVQTARGVRVWREFRPIEKVGLYVPGGKAAYPSTVLMLAVPAQIAGCSQIIMTTPADSLGKCNPAVLVAADLCGVKEIYKIGGVQAVAALAYGTETIPRVYKIFGPGNQYVTTAKMLVYGTVDIDMPAGPSELAVIADNSAPPTWVAADLLTQLEHGEDSQSILITWSGDLARQVINEINNQLPQLDRRKIIEKSLRRSFVVLVKDWREAARIASEYAPEHLEIISREEKNILGKINNAGSIFLGPYTCEPLGDYATGANHTLPTSGYAKMFSGLSVESFGKKIQVQKVSRSGWNNIKKAVTTIARAEGLDAHEKAVLIRR